MFAELFNLLDDGTEGKVNDEDIKTGFMLYSAVVFCYQMEMEIFLDDLISTENSRTIIKTIINNIDSGIFKEDDRKWPEPNKDSAYHISWTNSTVVWAWAPPLLAPSNPLPPLSHHLLTPSLP